VWISRYTDDPDESEVVSQDGHRVAGEPVKAKDPTSDSSNEAHEGARGKSLKRLKS